MKRICLLMGLGVVFLAACNGSGIQQPTDFPAPTKADQVLVDKDGCTWWVIGNATNWLWAPRINSAGEHICDGTGETPAVTPEAPTPDPEIAAAAPAPADPPQARPEPAMASATAAPPRVSVEIVPAPSQNAATPGGTSLVQVATFAEQSNAKATVALFRQAGLPIHSDGNAAGKDGFYRIVLGPFSPDAATDAQRKAADAGFADAFIYKR